MLVQALFKWRPEYKLKEQVVNFKPPFGLRGPHELLI